MSRPRGTKPDESWLSEFRNRMSERGAQTSLAEKLGVVPSTISKLVNGGIGSMALFLRISRELDMSPPVSQGFDPLEQTMLLAFRDIREALGDEGAREFVGNLQGNAEAALSFRNSVRDAAGKIATANAASLSKREMSSDVLLHLFQFRGFRNRLLGTVEDEDFDFDKLGAEIKKAHSELSSDEYRMWLLRRIVDETQ